MNNKCTYCGVGPACKGPCPTCPPNVMGTGGKMSELPLVDDLKYWRAERADEWIMDRFIRKAEQLTEENKKLNKDFDASKRFYEEVGYQKKSEDLQDKLDKVKNNLEFMIANGRNWGFPTATYAKQALTELEEK